jgi:deoxyribonuclease (pyrimidine dimer)
MTRINVLEPSELYDQHLLIELRELPRLFTYIEQHMLPNAIYSGPENYTLGKGHMKFFSNKALYLYKRMFLLHHESLLRGFNFKFDTESWNLRYNAIPNILKQDYFPTLNAIDINRERIFEKVISRPDFYRYYGKRIEPRIDF